MPIVAAVLAAAVASVGLPVAGAEPDTRWTLQQTAEKTLLAVRDYAVDGRMVFKVTLACDTRKIELDFTAVETGLMERGGFELKRFYDEITARIRYGIDDEPLVSHILSPSRHDRLSLEFGGGGGAPALPLAVLAHALRFRVQLPYPALNNPVVGIDFDDPALASFRRQCGKLTVYQGRSE